jgi:hypothetical protein
MESLEATKVAVDPRMLEESFESLLRDMVLICKKEEVCS